jgi:hypothetical protein
MAHSGRRERINMMYWFRFWTHRQQYRRRRAYFRPTDSSDLTAPFLPLIDGIVTVRFADVAGPAHRFAGLRLYRILGPGTSAPLFERPARDFDFLD